MPTRGMIRSATSEETILPNAAPMITPTARSMTLPFTAKSRNSLSMLMRVSSWVVHLQDLELFVSRRGAQRDAVARARLEQRARDGRDPRDTAVRGIDLVDAHDAHRALARSALHAHARAEEDLVGVAAGRAHHLGRFQPLDEEAHAPVDLAQAFLPIEVVGVLGTVAERGGPGHGLHHLGPLELEHA